MVKLQHRGSIIHESGKLSRIHSLAWSPNGRKLAVVTFPNTLHMYDEYGEKKDKIPPRPREQGGPKNFVVNAAAFSVDSTMLGVAQSDGILFVYKVRVSVLNYYILPISYVWVLYTKMTG